jgi:transcriptional regulator GlxA family with amidase domain
MRSVAIVCFPGLQPLDVTGPHEVLAGANQAIEHLGRPGPRYRIDLVAAQPGPVTGESGLTLVATEPLDDEAHDDTIIVPGGRGTRAVTADDPVVAWLRARRSSARRLAAVCTGTFVLAEAGLCAGRRVTTHWAHAADLAARHPDLIVDPDPIHLRDGSIWTSAGVTAGIDLTLALVEEDCGQAVAQLVARHLVVYLRRPGGQSQFGSAVWAEPTEVAPIRAACELVHHAPATDLGVEALASHAGLSPRHFTRLFRAELGESPARYVERVRVEAAPDRLPAPSASPVAHPTEEFPPCRSPSSCSTRSPPWTPSGPTRSSSGSPTPPSRSWPSAPGSIAATTASWG